MNVCREETHSRFDAWVERRLSLSLRACAVSLADQMIRKRTRIERTRNA